MPITPQGDGNFCKSGCSGFGGQGTFMPITPQGDGNWSTNEFPALLAAVSSFHAYNPARGRKHTVLDLGW